MWKRATKNTCEKIHFCNISFDRFLITILFHTIIPCHVYYKIEISIHTLAKCTYGFKIGSWEKTKRRANFSSFFPVVSFDRFVVGCSCVCGKCVSQKKKKNHPYNKWIRLIGLNDEHMYILNVWPCVFPWNQPLFKQVLKSKEKRTTAICIHNGRNIHIMNIIWWCGGLSIDYMQILFCVLFAATILLGEQDNLNTVLYWNFDCSSFDFPCLSKKKKKITFANIFSQISFECYICLRILYFTPISYDFHEYCYHWIFSHILPFSNHNRICA